jgi:hypothetical protein
VPEVLVRMRAHEGSRALARQTAANVEYLRIVRRFLASNPQLSASDKESGRRGLANVHYKLARLYLRAGDERRARRHARAFLKLRPYDRRALRLWISDFGFWIGLWTGRVKSRA